MQSGITINNVQDVLAAALQILESAEHELIWLVPPSLLSLSLPYGFAKKIRAFLQQGGMSRGIISTAGADDKDIAIYVGSGGDVRHSDDAYELFILVGDRQQSVSAVNTGIGDFTLATPVVAFWSEDPAYVDYLLFSFEHAWSQLTPAPEQA